MITYNVNESILPAALKITPGKRSPTVSVLDNSNLRAISALVSKEDCYKIMDSLEDIGATDILIFNVNNSRM